MTDKEQKKAAKAFVAYWKDKGSEKSDTQTYWNQLLIEVFGAEKLAGLIEYEKPVIVNGNQKYIDAYIHHDNVRIIVEQKSLGRDLKEKGHQSGGISLTPYEQAKRYDDNLNKSERADYIITCNFSEFNIYDMNNKNAAPVQIMLFNLPKEYHLMKFLVGSKSERIKKEEKLSTDAGLIVRKMRDALQKQYVDDEGDVNLNKLCVRLVFCFYAEDADVFGRRQFRDYLKDTPVNKWHRELKDLFRVLNTPEDKRDKYDDDKLNAFPYVNGGLFGGDDIIIPSFTDEIADIIINSACEFDWAEISPTIFGAVFESTMNPETRHSGGMHYTSIENIHKVIDSLFLDELRDEFAEIKAVKSSKNGISKMKLLNNFHNKLSSLVFLDPACGSGNFLTESYLSLRKIENELIEIEQSLISGQLMIDSDFDPIKVSINQFYGIEINDFAVAVAKTALWIAEIQMLQKTQELLPDHDFPILPLETNYNIHEGNALHMDWNTIVPKDSLSYIMGNPPFLGARIMNAKQKNDVFSIFDGVKNNGNLDYVACWYKKAADLMTGTDIRAALVSTNSITQGEQVAILWKELFNHGVHIDFAYRTFIWDSESDSKAHVHCVIVGFSKAPNKAEKKIYDNGIGIIVKNINGYLVDANDIVIESRTTPICQVPPIGMGNQPIDEGNYLFTEEEMQDFIKLEPASAKYFKKWLGSQEFINGFCRYCLWLGDCSPKELLSMPECLKRVDNVRRFRKSSKRTSTLKLAEKPTRFQTENMPNSTFILVPKVSSEKREYVPIGFLTPDILCSDLVFIIPNATLYHFGVLTSSVHMAWMRAVAGRLKSDYRYSKDIVYNNFPWCSPTVEQRTKIEKTAQQILDARDKYSDSNFAEMYGEKMYLFDDLVKAHKANDKAVIEAYGFNKDMSESEIVAALMKMYQRMTEEK